MALRTAIMTKQKAREKKKLEMERTRTDSMRHSVSREDNTGDGDGEAQRRQQEKWGNAFLRLESMVATLDPSKEPSTADLMIPPLTQVENPCLTPLIEPPPLIELSPQTELTPLNNPTIVQVRIQNDSPQSVALRLWRVYRF